MFCSSGPNQRVLSRRRDHAEFHENRSRTQPLTSKLRYVTGVSRRLSVPKIDMSEGSSAASSRLMSGYRCCRGAQVAQSCVFCRCSTPSPNCRASGPSACWESGEPPRDGCRGACSVRPNSSLSPSSSLLIRGGGGGRGGKPPPPPPPPPGLKPWTPPTGDFPPPPPH